MPKQMDKASLNRRKQLLLSEPGSLVAIHRADSVVSANNARNANETRGTPLQLHQHSLDTHALRISWSEPPQSCQAPRSPSSPTESSCSSSLEHDPDVVTPTQEATEIQMESYYALLADIQSPPLELTFRHPCMTSNDTFPAILKRVEYGKALSPTTTLDWPYCLKQMWAD